MTMGSCELALFKLNNYTYIFIVWLTPPTVDTSYNGVVWKFLSLVFAVTSTAANGEVRCENMYRIYAGKDEIYIIPQVFFNKMIAKQNDD